MKKLLMILFQIELFETKMEVETAELINEYFAGNIYRDFEVLASVYIKGSMVFEREWPDFLERPQLTMETKIRLPKFYTEGNEGHIHFPMVLKIRILSDSKL